jgi:hypothetical protein
VNFFFKKKKVGKSSTKQYKTNRGKKIRGLKNNGRTEIEEASRVPQVSLGRPFLPFVGVALELSV